MKVVKTKAINVFFGFGNKKTTFCFENLQRNTILICSNQFENKSFDKMIEPVLNTLSCLHL